MAKINIRNRNKGKYDKDGTPKKPNWEYRFEGAKIDGKRKSISKAGFRTKAEAETAGAKALAEYDNAGLKFTPSEVSVSDYLDYWLKSYCQVNVGDSTMRTYRNIINNHLRPRIGFYKLKSVTPMILQDAINDLAIHSGFTKGYLKNIVKVIKGAFKYAVLPANLIKVNPALYVSIPRVDTIQESEEIIILPKDDVIKILDRFKGTKDHYYAMLTAYYTGLRVSEVFGLTWDDIDFEKKTLTVNKIAKKIEKDGAVSEAKRKRGTRGKSTTRWYFGSCKTTSSYRTISIGDTLINHLKDYKAFQEQNEQEYGELYVHHYLKPEVTENNKHVQRLISLPQMDFELPLEETHPVFIKENGEYRGTDSVRYPSKIIRYELGIHFNFHAFRHTHATLLIEAGTPIKAVSARLGHKNVRTTLETYVHVTENMINDAVNKFETIGNLSTNPLKGGQKVDSGHEFTDNSTSIYS